MKQVVRLSLDMVDWKDKHFDLEVFKDERQALSPNTLPLFWKYKQKWISCSFCSINGSDQSILAMTYSDDISYEEVLDELIDFYELSIFDISRLLCLLEKFSKDLDKRIWSRKLNIPLKDWDKIKELNSLSNEWKNYFISKSISYKRIRSFDDVILRESIEFLLKLNPGINILEQIAVLLKEISLRDDVIYSKVLKNIETKSILEKEELTISQKLAIIRGQLLTKRYPVMSRYKEELDLKKSDFDKLNNLHMGIDETFESPGIELKYLMKSSRDIDNLQQWLKENKDSIKSVLELQKGEI